MKLFAKIATVVGTFVTATATMACPIIVLDEPDNTPKSLIK